MQCGHSCSEDRIRRGRIWVRHYAVHLLFWFFPTNDRNTRLPSPCLKSSSVSPEQTGSVNAVAGTKACVLIIVPEKTNTPSHMSEINLVMWQILKGNYHNNSSPKSQVRFTDFIYSTLNGGKMGSKSSCLFPSLSFSVPLWLYLSSGYLTLFQFPRLLKLITQFSDFHTDTQAWTHTAHHCACIQTHICTQAMWSLPLCPLTKWL